MAPIYILKPNGNLLFGKTICVAWTKPESLTPGPQVGLRATLQIQTVIPNQINWYKTRDAFTMAQLYRSVYRSGISFKNTSITEGWIRL